MPTAADVAKVLDAQARASMREAARAVEPIVRQEAPGGLGQVMRPTVRKTPTGYRAVVAPPRRARYKGGATAAQVVRWVTRGTGLYRQGPGPKRKITSKRGVLGTMTLPGGTRVRTVRGQHPNPFVARAEQRSREPIERALREGAQRAADAMRRL